MKKIITYGTFDLLHWGHINLLCRAKKLGDYLIVGLSSDEFNELKGKKAYHNFETRKKMLEAIKYVDLVICENSWEQKKEDLDLHKIDVLVMGSDWKNKFDHLANDKTQIIYLERTKNISTTKIVNDLKNSL